MPHFIRHDKTWLGVIAAVAVVLIGSFSALVPAFEAPDEPGHFHYVQSLADGHGLPVQGRNGVYDPELSQPPLYYSIQALVARLIPASGARLPTRDRQNVFQNTTASGNVNLYSHPAAESAPWRGEVLQLHAMRLLNLLFVALTALATYGLARELGLSSWLALSAPAALLFLPQFDFIAGALNADNLITALASVALYLLVRWLGRPAAAWPVVGIGLATGAAMLSKLSGLAVLGFVIAVMLWRACRERSARVIGQAAGAAVIAAALGGWWYARNLVLFGDALGWEPMLHAIGAMRRSQPLTVLQALGVLLQQRTTALGVFGWDNVRLPQWTYTAADAIAVLALIGLVMFVCHSERGEESSSLESKPGLRARFFASLRMTSPVWLPVLWILLFSASLVRWVEVNTDAAQWRLLLPVFPALAILLVAGLRQLVGRWAVGLPLALAALSAASLVFVIRPAYAPEQTYAGPIQHRLGVRFGERLELAGYDEPSPRTAAASQPVAVVLYWRVLQPLPEDDIVDLVALDASGQSGWKESTWPQEGRAPTSQWLPGALVRDQHLIAPAGLAPGVWNLQLDVYRPLEGAPRLPIDAAGNTIVDVGRFLQPAPHTSAASAKPEAAFEADLALLSHRQLAAPDNLQVGLQWRSTGQVNLDYTVFVHLLDAAGNVVAQSDSQPGGGRFPTSLLGPGVTVDDTHVLNTAGVPAGSYQLEIGLYDAQSGRRLRLQGSATDAFSWPVQLPN